MAKCPYCGRDMIGGYIGCAPARWLVSPMWYQEWDPSGKVGESLGRKPSPLKIVWGMYYYEAERCTSCQTVVFKYPNVDSSEGEDSERSQ